MYGKMRLGVLKGMALKLTLLASVEHKRRYFEECWCFFYILWKPMATINCLVTNIHTGLEQLVGVNMNHCKGFSPLTNGLIWVNGKWKFTFSVGVYIHQPYITRVCNALVSLFFSMITVCVTTVWTQTTSMSVWNSWVRVSPSECCSSRSTWWVSVSLTH